jgi:uncharacterized protein
LPDHPLRRILSGIVRGGAATSFEITYVHRGAPDDRVTISGSGITNVRKGSFILSDEETQIPFHRILEVKDTRTGLIIWKKRPARMSDRNP